MIHRALICAASAVTPAGVPMIRSVIDSRCVRVSFHTNRDLPGDAVPWQRKVQRHCQGREVCVSRAMATAHRLINKDGLR
jgi:hypothetical protein